LLPNNPSADLELESEMVKADNQKRLDEWQRVALVLDRVFFILFIIAMPCTALLLVFAHTSIRNNYRANLTKIEIPTADAICDRLYKPMIT